MTHSRDERRPCVVSLPPPIAQNPYQRLLYEHLRAHGVELAEGAPSLHASWLWRSRPRVGVLHFHWPQIYWRQEEGPRALRRPLSWLRLGLFAGRLAAARALRYRIVWTVHQPRPHEVEGQIDAAGAKLLQAAAHALVVHDRSTFEAVAAEWPGAARKAVVIPHGSFAGAYPAGRSRAEVRIGLGLPPDALVFLCFGNLRRYKEVDLLVTAFQHAALPRAALLIAGAPLDEEHAGTLRESVASIPGIHLLLEYVPDERVAELFGAADVAVLPRSDGGTSGALVLALSLGLPVVAARRPAYEELLGGGAAGWLFTPGDAESLAQTLRQVDGEREILRAKAQGAVTSASRLDWDQVAARTATVLRG